MQPIKIDHDEQQYKKNESDLTMNDAQSDKSKVIVDEDWKSRVQAEKEAAKNAAAGEAAKPATASDTAASDASEQSLQLPEPSFSLLITTLATQVLAGLGQTGGPEPSDEVPVNLDLAKHYIDTLELLEKKTAGNLTEDESQLLTRFLYELRMLFVSVRNQVKSKPNS